MKLRSLPRLRGRVGERVFPQRDNPLEERTLTRRDAPTSPASGRGAATAPRRHSASALYFFSDAFRSASAASGSAPAFLALSLQVLTSGSAAFFQAAVCSAVSL
ncbi:hypothetical protein ABIG06_001408 [Bradyrhizobium sp. USDA 326]